MKDTLLLWLPRAIGIALALFLGLFALDAFADGFQWRAVIAFLIHLAPAFLVLVVVAFAWRRPLVGAIAFAILGVLYAVNTRTRPDWILAVSGPLVLTALLYLASWLTFRGPRLSGG